MGRKFVALVTIVTAALTVGLAGVTDGTYDSDQRTAYRILADEHGPT